MPISDDHIRRLETAEAVEISALAMRSKAWWGYSPEFMERCRDELSYTPDTLASESFDFVGYISDERIAGFYATEKLSESCYELDALFLEPEFIGKGVGRALIEHAKASVRAAGGSRLTIQGDPNAERFYRAAGGVRVGERESGSVPGRMLPLFEISLAKKQES